MVLTHSLDHIKYNLPKKGFFATLFDALARSLCGDGAEVKTGVCGTEGGDGRDLGKNEGFCCCIFWRGDVVLHDRSTAKKKKMGCGTHKP